MKKYIFTCALAATLSAVVSQDLSLPNLNMALLHLNPSFAGSNGGIRNQFASQVMASEYSGAYRGFINSVDGYVRAIDAGVGLSVSASQLGPFTTRTVDASFAKHFSFQGGKIRLIPSVKLTYGQKFIAPNWILPSGTPVRRYESYGDFGAGLLFNYRGKLYMGVAANRLARPVFGQRYIDPVATLITVHASYNLQLSEQSLLQFSGWVMSEAATMVSTASANLILYDHLVLGLGLEAGNGSFINMGYRGEMFSVVGGYQANASRLAPAWLEMYQLNASFNLRNKNRRAVFASLEGW